MDEQQKIAKRFKLTCEELGRQTDRGVAIIGMAFLDDMLGRLLRQRLKGDKAIIKRLFKGPTAPLQGVANRNHMAYATDLISKKVHSEIAQLNKIRVPFAHFIEPKGRETEPLTFKSRQIVDLCSELILVPERRKKTGREMAETNARELFSTSVFLLAMWMQTALRDGTKIDP